MSGEYNFINAEIKTGDQKLGRTEICPFYILAHSSVCVFKKKQKTEDLRKRSRAKRRPSFLDTTRPNFAATVHPCLRWSTREPREEGERRYLFKVKKIFRMKRWNGAIWRASVYVPCRARCNRRSLWRRKPIAWGTDGAWMGREWPFISRYPVAQFRYWTEWSGPGREDFRGASEPGTKSIGHPPCRQLRPAHLEVPST